MPGPSETRCIGLDDMEKEKDLETVKQDETANSFFSRGEDIGHYPDMPHILIQDAVDNLLSWCIQNKVKDINIETGKRLWVLVGGRRQVISDRILSHDEVSGILNHFYKAENAAGMVAGGSPTDFGYNIKVGPNRKARINLRINATAGLDVRSGGTGLQITLRVISDKPIPLDLLNVPQELKDYFRAQQGLNLICGPTGSGKSVLASSLIDWRCRQEGAYEKVIELAQPIETVYPDSEYPDSHVFQSEVGKHITLHGPRPDPAEIWASAVSNTLRRGPSMIYVTEARGRVTMEAMLRGAQTGHLVLSTVHTIGVSETIGRIVMEFPEESRRSIALDLLAALNLVACQLLVPMIGGGVTAVREYMVFDDRVKTILFASDYSEWTQIIREMLKSGRVIGQTMAQDARRAMASGVISWDTCEAVSARTSDETSIVRLASAPDILERLERAAQIEREKKPGRTLGDADMICFLATLQVEKGDDLLMNVGLPAKIKGDKGTHNASRHILTDASMDRIAGGLLRAEDLASFIKTKEFSRSLELEGIGRFRVNLFVQRGHTGMAIRRINAEMPTFESHRLPEVLKVLSLLRRGIFLVTGETGSGKSTTLAAMINWRNRHADGEHIITIENPIEYVHDPIKCILTQREVGRDTQSFEAAVIAALRQNPDALLIGEIREIMVMRQALVASDTGHPVYGTLHANSAYVTINRIVAMFPYQEREMVLLSLSLNLKGVLSQRLVKRKDGEGRVLATELMLNKGKITDLIREGKTHLIRDAMRESPGMWTMEQSLADLVVADVISLTEAMLESDWPEEVQELVGKALPVRQ
ncbi:hypothetical protein A0U91_16395 (plasmid) [Acetobacter persici]|uniref:AAA+ ATPase domain-containing protein n=2 Tax=Acetobacter persici TaxID=1076596 RepID=A0A1U9LJK5_9PROT|nr:hypothetical protein A0U91_16395 [Acetobacter persici]